MRSLYTGLRFNHTVLIVMMALLCTLALAGCDTISGYGYGNQTVWPDKTAAPAQKTPSNLAPEAVPAPDVEEAAALENIEPVKVALLLPLSGQHANLGESMQRAAEMALFDIGQVNFELIPKDTKGTPEGAETAARQALNEGAKLVIGPVFANEVRAAQRVTTAGGVNMVAFSTDWTLANKSTFLIGFLPFDQVERVVRYAAASGLNRIGVLSPSDTYGNGVVSAFESISRPAGVSVARVERLPSLGTQFPMAIRAFSDYDQRQSSGDAHGAPFDAVLLPLGGNMAREVSRLLMQNGLGASVVKRLGTGLMDDPALALDENLQGAWFAAPSPHARIRFEQRYGSTYGVKPMRLASLAYDATALASVLTKNANPEAPEEAFSHAAITNPNGFAGVDGIFRFRTDGISERGLAVLEYRNGTIVVVDDAPDTFQQPGL